MARFVICGDHPHDPRHVQNWVLALSLVKSGHDVIFVVGSVGTGIPAEYAQIRVFQWPHHGRFYWRSWLFFFGLVARERPDAVLANFFSVNIAMIVSWVLDVPHRIAWSRSLRSQAVLELQRSNARQYMVDRLKQLALAAATDIVAVSQAGVVDLQVAYHVPPEKCRVFHTCRPDPRRVIGLEGRNEPPRHRLICIGRLVRSKGQDVLIRAAALLRRENPGLEFDVEFIGEGDQKGEYQRLVDENGLGKFITFTGQIAHEAVYRRLAGATIVVVSSRSDAGPGVIPEAFGIGLPVIGTSIPAIVEHVGGSGAVVLVEPDDVVGLARALGELLRDVLRRRSMAANARELFLRKFDLTFWVQDVRQWLDDTIGAPAAKPSPLATSAAR